MKLICRTSDNVTPLFKAPMQEHAPVAQCSTQAQQIGLPTPQEFERDKSDGDKPAESLIDAEHLPQKSAKRIAKTMFVGLLALGLVGAAGFYGFQFFQHTASHEETDDAYVTGHLHQVSTRIDGTVEQVLVDDNEHVKKGQALAILDPRDYKVKVDQALAHLAQAKRKATTAQTSVSFQDVTAQGADTNAKGTIDNAIASIARSEANVRESRAAIEVAQSNLSARDAELDRAQLDYHRADNLERQGAISTSDKDAAKRDYLVALENRKSALNAITEATARLEQAQQNVLTSKADLVKAHAQLQLAKASAVQTQVNEHQYQTDMAAVEAAQAELNAAQLNLSYTRIVAPTAGRVGKKTVEAGQRVEPGQPLMTIVADNPWVVANYKETQLKRMKTGQMVHIKVDSFPDHDFKGTVLSFSPASGTSFAVLPSDNATGNFTKIVQRVPVKILFTPDSIKGYEDRMAPGLSVITSVEVEQVSVPEHKIASIR